MNYCTNCGPKHGPYRWRDAIHAIGVYEASNATLPIGYALAFTWDEELVAVWRLIIRDREIPGRWTIVDREFRPVAGE